MGQVFSDPAWERESMECHRRHRVAEHVFLRVNSLRSSLHGFAVLFEEVLKRGDSSTRLSPVYHMTGIMKDEIRTLRTEMATFKRIGEDYLGSVKMDVGPIQNAVRGLVKGGGKYFRVTFPPLMTQYDPPFFCAVAVATAATLLDDLGLEDFAAKVAEVGADTVCYDDFAMLLRQPQLDQEEHFKFETSWHKLELANDYCDSPFISDFRDAMGNLRWLHHIHEAWHHWCAYEAEAETKIPPTDTTTTPDDPPPPEARCGTSSSSTYYGAA